ncbi:hypothetical protein P168DRAFT_90046 [Aspergillus campestris IBT 28561]|uniref:Uncharacterized protein n=1 Tax=Aspergillus campestris (strain IBT 28561) TaxID=1392248 RepID=A0A2I1DBG6_ASPC2|nr:uncharacterized protein P168DRAFT_90046 [Aspergillus campestris IBT 28561]PKY07190.1 hypothetical protein P168DRAFT_90046 [Aspergillus campestris IBT 28561]
MPPAPIGRRCRSGCFHPPGMQISIHIDTNYISILLGIILLYMAFQNDVVIFSDVSEKYWTMTRSPHARFLTSQE